MADGINRVRTEEVDWQGILPWVRLFRSFRMAIHPPKMLLALLLVVLIYLSGHVLDSIWRPSVAPEEINQYAAMGSDEFSMWLGAHAGQEGTFAATMDFTLGAFDRGVNGAASLNFGIGYLLGTGASDGNSVASALHDLFVILPGWLYRAHFWFMFVYSAVVLGLWSLIGGAITRMAALQAARGDSGSAVGALVYSGRRYFWFFFTPLFPLLLSLALGLVLMLGGLAFFNLPFLDVLGGLGFVVALVCGFLLAMTLLLTAGGGHLFYPALAVEGTDTFDAIGRCFGYLIGRPWRWLFYTLLSMVYFAVTYMFVGAVLLLTLSVTQWFVRRGVFAMTPGGMNRFDAILPPPRFGQLVYQVKWAELSLPARAAAALVWVWVFLTVGLLAAYAISFYCSVQTWIYLLLRRASDGTLIEDIFIEPLPAAAPPPPEAAPAKVESPAAAPEAVGTAQDGVSEENTDQ